MQSRISELFKNKPSNILSVYYTAGFPELDNTLAIAQNLESAGADMIEIGFPFSDPAADGPIIQASSKTALDQGMNLKLLFNQLSALRPTVKIPVLLMGYFNPVLQFGVENFCKACAEVGIDGCIIPDLPFQEFQDQYAALFKKYGLENIWLITPQTSEERIKLFDAHSDGFLYALSASSTTGKQVDFSDNSINYFDRLKNMNLKNPFLIGFGIGNKTAFNQACSYAQGAIVGTAFVKVLGKKYDKVAVDAFVASLR